MSGYDIGPRIGIKGESEFNSQIKNINGNIKLLGSELNTLTKKYDGNADSLEALKAKNEVITKQMDQQKSKLNVLGDQYSKQNDVLSKLQDELDKTKEAYGENSIEATKAKNAVDKQTETMRALGTSMNETKGFIYKLDNEISANVDTINNLVKSNKQAESSLSQLTSTIDRQKKQLEELKNAYQDALIAKGKDSAESKELEAKISSLSRELNANVTALNKVKKEADDVDQSLNEIEDGAKNASDGFTVMKGAMANISAKVITELADGVKELATQSENASAQFRASTGATVEEMKQYNQEMESLYDNNYGESLEDIAASMAEVKQQTKEIDPSKIKELTKYSIVVRDTFGFDIRESMRAVNMLMDQFGITGVEAFNLIAQGAQNGLDKNGDLLDSINEYSVHYKQMGYDANDFFNSLQNGAASGTFSVDKLGDAMKEFGIRSKDTANSTTEGFQLIGLNADVMRGKFVAGGNTAKEAMDQTLKALFSVNDEVKRNQAGVDLFGTMWEDLGIDGVKALTNVNGAADKTKNTIAEIDEIKYDTTEASIKELGRTLKSDLLEPVIKDILPAVKSGVNWTVDNLPKILPILKTIGAVATASFAVKKTVDLKKSVSDLGETLKKLGSSDIPFVSKAFQTLGPMLSANPWITVGAGVAALGVTLLSFCDFEDETTKRLKENAESAKEDREAWEEMSLAREDSMAKSAGEFDYYNRLKTELKSLADENGTVKEGYEGRAAFIANELNNALGTEITMVNGVIQSYQDQLSVLDEVIEKQRAKAIISAGEAQYTIATQNQTKALAELSDAEKDYLNEKQIIEDHLSKLREQGYDEEYINMTKTGDLNKQSYIAAQGAYLDKKAVAEGYTETIAQQEYLQKLYLEGGAENIAAINEYVKGVYYDGTETVRLSSQQKYDIQNRYLEDLKTKYAETGDKMYEDQINAAEARLAELETELSTQTATITNGTDNAMKAWAELGQKSLDSYKENSDEFTLAAAYKALQVKNGVVDATPESNKAWEALRKSGMAVLKDGEYEWSDIGRNYVDGINKGINDKVSVLINNVDKMGEIMKSTIKKTLDEHSPSKEGEKIGSFFDLGIADGVDDSVKDVTSSVANLGKAMLNESSKIPETLNFGNMQKKTFELDQSLISNAYATVKNEQTIILKNIMNSKVVGEEVLKFISNGQQSKMKARGSGV